MTEYRVSQHPILPVPPDEFIEFTWQGQTLQARPGEMIASALFAHGVRIFGHHPRDGAPQGIFCANGQCAQCMVIADGRPVKSCMTPVTPGMRVEPLDALPELPEVVNSESADQRIGESADQHAALSPKSLIEVPVLILGGGPAGMSAAIELARHGIKSLLVDDKHRLGGKLVLQTHRFFGDINAVYAGTRGIDIATRLEGEVAKFPEIEVWLNSTALAVFSDGVVGVLRQGEGERGREGEGETTHGSRLTAHEEYELIRPQILLVATGAREKSLVFRGNTLPGVYGAGAFQTLVNRDLVKAANRLFIVGGGNVGLIAGYHALQAGIEVVGLVEALPECGGYKVHKDKLVRMGVPIYTSHTVISANGTEQVESVTIAQVDAKFRPIPGTEQSFACDTLLIAVGLESVNEFTEKARAYGMQVFDAGDAEEIAEASAAMFSGKIRGREIAQSLGADVDAAPRDWYHTAEVLKSKPGEAIPERIPDKEEGVFPVFHCSQEIPCNPCTSVCPQHLIHIDPENIRALPEFMGAQMGKECLGCEKCVTICPGLAITLVDYRKDAEMPTVTLAYEFQAERLHVGDRVTVLDSVGAVLGEVEVTDVRAIKRNDRTVVVKARAPRAIARRIAGIRVQQPWVSEALEDVITRIDDDEIVCRCERVTAGEIRALIRQGYHDMNEIKSVTRAGMGACGGKTCTALIQRLFREEGVPMADVTPNVKRPLFVEAPLGVFAQNEWRRANGEGRIGGSADQRGGGSADQRSGGAGGQGGGGVASPQSPIPNPQSPATGSGLPSTYDVIILGAGSVGAPTALALAKAGVKTLVLDPYASQGQGSQKAAIGGVRATHSDPAKIRLCLRSLEIFSTWAEVYGHAIEWTTGGYSFVAYREQEEATLKGLLKVQQTYGLNIDWYDRDALLEIAPALNPEGLRGGTYSPGDGHCSTLLAGHAIYDAAKQAGATFRFKEGAREILTSNGASRRIVGVRTEQGEYHAPVVINAAGAWAGELGALVGLPHPILPESHEGGITEPVAHFLNPMIVDIRPKAGSKNYYYFQLHTGQIVFCITPEPPIPGLDCRETSEFLPLVAPRMVEIMPRLAGIRVRRTWRGLYPMTPDGAPLVGWARDLEGYLMAVGMCGQGFMLGPGLGELLARLVTKQTVDSDTEILDVLSPYRKFAGQEALK